MKQRFWMLLLFVAVGVGALAIAGGPVGADNCVPACGPGYHCLGSTCIPDGCECFGDFGCPVGKQCDGCHCVGGSNCSGTCTTLYNGYQLTNHCALNGGSGACFCPLPGTWLSGNCRQ